MAGTPVDCGTGTTLVAGTSSWTAEITSLSFSGISREALETTHLSTAKETGTKFGSRTYIPGDLTDPGELQVSGQFNPDKLPPVTLVAETWTVTFPLYTGDSTAANWAGSGFCTSFNSNVELEGVSTFDMTIKLSGNVTQTVAA